MTAWHAEYTILTWEKCAEKCFEYTAGSEKEICEFWEYHNIADPVPTYRNYCYFKRKTEEGCTGTSCTPDPDCGVPELGDYWPGYTTAGSCPAPSGTTCTEGERRKGNFESNLKKDA